MPLATSTESLADFRWLVSPEAEPYLAAAAAEPDLLARASRLRATLTAERARLVAEQVGLRERGIKKFTAAGRMFFTPLGLEQATDGWTARHKAARFGGGRVCDFCCGIGGDLMALTARGPARGIDRDPVAALFAEANCRVASIDLPQLEGPRSMATLDVGEVSALALAAGDLWHIDPDRRPSGRRTTRIELHDPPAEAIDRLLAVAPAGAVKLAPAAELSESWRAAAELEWISSARECRQLVAWFGPLAEHPGFHRATLVPRSAGLSGTGLSGTGSFGTVAAPASVVGLPDVEYPIAASVGQYVFDPDPAVVAAGLVGSLANEHGLAALVPGGAYLAGDQPVDHPMLMAFAVSEVIPWDVRRLKRALAERRIGRLEVKQRGTRLDPAAVQRQLKVPGDEPATLILYRRAQSIVAILAERVKALS